MNSTLVRQIRTAFGRLNVKGRRQAWMFVALSTLAASIDSFALLLLARTISSFDIQLSGIEGGVGTSLKGLLFALTLFILRSFISGALLFFTSRNFASQETNIGQLNMQRIMERNWEYRKGLNRSDYFTAIDGGPYLLITGVVLPTLNMISELVLGVAVLVALVYAQPLTAAIAGVFFALVALAQHFLLVNASISNGQSMIKRTLLVQDQIHTSFDFGKTFTVMPSRSFDQQTENLRRSLAAVRANTVFLGSIPRYFMELVLILGILFIAGITYVISGYDEVPAALIIFTAAGFRLLPVVNRIQTLLMVIHSSLPTVVLAENLAQVKIPENNLEILKNPRSPGLVDVSEASLLAFSNVFYRYPNAEEYAISGLSYIFERGRQYAIVGPSGGGKTTFVDLCLQILKPTQGSVSLFSKDLTVSYVPQDIPVALGSLIDNVSLEWDQNLQNKEHFERAIRDALIDDLSAAQQTHSHHSQEKLSLSGGQRQRLGLARAMYRSPDLLVLDEATSALDATTEHSVMKVIKELRGNITTIVVAHRLPTIQGADIILYIDKGELIASGSFSQLMNLPQFAEQVKYGQVEELFD